MTTNYSVSPNWALLINSRTRTRDRIYRLLSIGRKLWSKTHKEKGKNTRTRTHEPIVFGTRFSIWQLHQNAIDRFLRLVEFFESRLRTESACLAPAAALLRLPTDRDHSEILSEYKYSVVISSRKQAQAQTRSSGSSGNAFAAQDNDRGPTSPTSSSTPGDAELRVCVRSRCIQHLRAIVASGASSSLSSSSAECQ